MTVGSIGLDKDLQSSFALLISSVNNLAEVARRFDAGEFDLVASGRALLTDPHWVEKVREGAPFKPFRLENYATLD